jgi:hypothetical protein
MVGYGKLFQGIDSKFKEFGGWVDVGLNSDCAGALTLFSVKRKSVRARRFTDDPKRLAGGCKRPEVEDMPVYRVVFRMQRQRRLDE